MSATNIQGFFNFLRYESGKFTAFVILTMCLVGNFIYCTFVGFEEFDIVALIIFVSIWIAFVTQMFWKYHSRSA